MAHRHGRHVRVHEPAAQQDQVVAVSAVGTEVEPHTDARHQNPLDGIGDRLNQLLPVGRQQAGVYIQGDLGRKHIFQQHIALLHIKQHSCCPNHRVRVAARELRHDFHLDGEPVESIVRTDPLNAEVRAIAVKHRATGIVKVIPQSYQLGLLLDSFEAPCKDGEQLANVGFQREAQLHVVVVFSAVGAGQRVQHFGEELIAHSTTTISSFVTAFSRAAMVIFFQL